jgi:hypothetical protein
MNVTETTVETGLEYVKGRAGARPGATRAVAEAHSMIVNRAGVVFVAAVDGGTDRDCLARRVAKTSLALYDALLELE